MLSPNDALAGLEVLVVEDEALVLMNLEDILEELGCRVVGPAMHLSKAEEIIATGAAPGVAILDVNVAGEMVFPLARTLAARNVSMIFATGYGRAGLPDEFHHNPVLQKPYTSSDVEAALREAVQIRAGS